MVPKCPVPAAMALTLKIGLLLLENTRGLKGITAIGWPIKKHMHFKQTQVMFCSSSHCFRHSSFMFTASSDSILMRGFVQLSPLHYQHPTVHIKPCFYTNTWHSGCLFCSCISLREAGPLLYLKLLSQRVTFCRR